MHETRMMDQMVVKWWSTGEVAIAMKVKVDYVISVPAPRLDQEGARSITCLHQFQGKAGQARGHASVD